MSILTAAAALAVPAWAKADVEASTLSLPSAETMTLQPGPAQVESTSARQANTEKPLYLADAAPSDAPNVHGFISLPVKTAYITPRGLVVENQGTVFQPVGGIIFPIGDFGVVKDVGIITGIWQSFNSAQNDPQVGPWNEVDYFFSVTGKIGKVTGTLTYGAWLFPQSTTAKPDTEHNIDLKLAFDDSEWWGESGFALNPYVDIFYAVAGSSTVVQGDTGSTGYLEVGVVPTYVYKGITDLPITFTFPIYFSVGPSGYWDATNDDDIDFGVLSAGVNASVPLTAIIPTRYGHWHFDAGVTYFNLLNGTLFDSGKILSGNDDRNIFLGSVGIGVNF